MIKAEYTKKVPNEVLNTAKTLTNKGFEAYLIGGCVRDMLLHRKPKDWDITTNATPEQIISLFPETYYENTYGTVGVVNKEEGIDETLKVIEVTPYRLEDKYSNKRHPDSVTFSQNIDDDLKRRDFTINAIAIDPDKGHVVDLYKGREDLEKKVLKTVGNPEDRFNEDALRILRAARLSAELNFSIESETEAALIKNAHLLKEISKERIRDEFTRIIMSDNPMIGLELARRYKLLKYIVPELEEGIGIEQGGTHIYDVWEHILRTVQHTADKKWSLEVRLAALFHDIAKPQTRQKFEGKDKWSFYNHELVGAKIAKKALTDLKFSNKIIEKVTKLVRWHMFFTDTESITHSAVRRLVTQVGQENVWDLVNLRIADRVGTGRPKEEPYRLRKYQAMIEEVMRDPVSVGMLKIDGKRIMDVTQETPGPKIGFILHALLEEVIEDPKLNTEEYLENKAKELIKLSEKELKKLGEKGKEVKSKEEEKKVGEIRKKYFVE